MQNNIFLNEGVLVHVQKCIERAEKNNLIKNGSKSGFENTLLLTHMHCVKLDFEKLAEANDQDFNHDISGINIHFDPQNVEIKDFFSPRCQLSDDKIMMSDEFIAWQSDVYDSLCFDLNESHSDAQELCDTKNQLLLECYIKGIDPKITALEYIWRNEADRQN